MSWEYTKHPLVGAVAAMRRLGVTRSQIAQAAGVSVHTIRALSGDPDARTDPPLSLDRMDAAHRLLVAAVIECQRRMIAR